MVEAQKYAETGLAGVKFALSDINAALRAQIRILTVGKSLAYTDFPLPLQGGKRMVFNHLFFIETQYLDGNNALS